MPPKEQKTPKTDLPAPKSTTLAATRQRAEGFLSNAYAANTKRSYRSDWHHFVSWCDEEGLNPFPADADTVILYLTAHADDLKTSTLKRRMSSINQAHTLARLPSPIKDGILQSVWDGIKREKGTLEKGKKALLSKDIHRMIDAVPDDLPGLRDRAMLLLGFSGGFRRSELVELDVTDVDFVRDGVVVHMRKSKTDQHGEGYKKGITFGSDVKTCPVKMLACWLEASALEGGPLFRPISKAGKVLDRRLTSQSVALIVKKAARRAGLDPKLYAGHSLRSGMATQAAISGASERSIIAQGGWKSEKMARRYIRDGSIFRENASKKLDL